MSGSGDHLQGIYNLTTRHQTSSIAGNLMIDVQLAIYLCYYNRHTGIKSGPSILRPPVVQ